MGLAKALVAVGILAAVLATPRAAQSEDLRQAATRCTDYADHLRNARAYLESSDREKAVAELKRARESLRSCEKAQGDETALAACASWIHTS
jgi:hypothetical protein